MIVANFVVQLENFWTAGRYFNKLYFINVCVKVFLILVFSPGGGGGGTPIYGLYRYVPRNRVWFLRFSVLK